jgi:hypothetical protein
MGQSVAMSQAVAVRVWKWTWCSTEEVVAPLCNPWGAELRNLVAVISFSIHCQLPELAYLHPSACVTVDTHLCSKQAQQFTKDLWERKIVSTTEIIGRAPVEAEQSLRGLDAATAADRILAVLLQIPDEQERIGMVAEAFIPPATETIDVYPSPSLLCQDGGTLPASDPAPKHCYAVLLLNCRRKVQSKRDCKFTAIQSRLGQNPSLPS